ncbi:polysaccharide pyruvyl transferase family protein [Pseudidiomarina sp.]|uniref:polysaccharide pyruvyl transferase family protein n=1 Tax=Pseudidiomarina sp. TaxID=2081707 RepID=UPI003A97F756
MTNKLAVVGPFADVNLGDYAMLVNNLALISPSEVVLFTYDQDFSSLLIRDYFPSSDIDVCYVEIDPIKASKINSNSMPHDIIAAISNLEEILRKLRSMGKILVNGGGYFNSLWFKPHRRTRLCQILAPALIASIYGIPVIFSGNGYGPFESEDIPFFERIFSFLKSSCFGSRDSLLSRVWGVKAGIEPARLHFIPDDLFPVEPDLLKGEVHFEVPSDSYCVLETYYTEDYLQAHKSEFINLFRFVQDELNLKLVLLPFHLGNGGLTQAKLIQSWDDRVRVIDISQRGYLPINDAMAIIANARFVISSRYHALVFAVQSKTPIFSVMRDVLESKEYYFNKNYGFLETALGRNFDPNLFLYDCFTTAFHKVENELSNITREQMRIFDAYLDEGLATARSARASFFKSKVISI